MDSVQRQIVLTERRLQELYKIRDGEIMRLSRQGWTARDLAATYGMTRQRVYQITNRK